MNYWIDTNLTFEYELAGRPFEQIAHFTRPWKSLLGLLKNHEEANTLRPNSHVLPTDKVALWGVLDRHRNLNIADLPKAEVVMQANSKIWCFENRPKVLPHAAIISQNIHKKDLLVAISSAKKWIVKDPFGVAGRERFNGNASTDLNQLVHWMKKSGRTDLLLEPFIDIDFEYSVHYEIDKKNRIQYLGASALLCDKNGGFRGNYTLPIAFQNTLISVRKTHDPVLKKLATLGYLGPLSIDGYLGSYEDDAIIQPLSEINARYTFGRMFLELQRILGRQDFLWWHPSPKMFKNISKFPLETQTLVFPLETLNDTQTMLLWPIKEALDEIKERT